MMEWGITWLRPFWLWGFLPLLILILLWSRQKRQRSDWDAVVDPELQAYVIEKSEPSKQAAPLVLFASWALALLLLAGPVWEQLEVPVFQAEQAEIVIFDLSRSMKADDISPDRLTRARFKLLDLLDRSAGRQTGLIAFAERPYVISPLTDDATTIAAFVPSLDPDVIPVQGNRPDLALDKANSLFDQAGIEEGHVILITDAVVTEADVDAASMLEQNGHKLSVLAIGTAAGAPLRDANGQFLKRSNGAVVVPRLDMSGLRRLASAGGGIAAHMSADTDDLDALESVRQSISIDENSAEDNAQKIYWVEYAPWGVWILIVLLLASFRRGLAS